MRGTGYPLLNSKGLEIGHGQWRVDLVRSDKNAPCVRAHVDKDQNTGAGGELGRAVQSDRIIDHEWYQVIIIP
ncbi:hypothetical protein MRQ86_00120 [Streptomyces sp. MMS21 TC-5]|uniref:hypothetical protein n=1 Tax=Streptomyces sp. MMS21 TC-5 TaxID=2925833 RepID=UPI001F6253DA|nr:hypothetical protein [Streptomyces sp. MMS21 TC-5]MCI4078787.1 hypothetical protein [Streptomyces sp. MMS21 TC-5]